MNYDEFKKIVKHKTLDDGSEIASEITACAVGLPEMGFDELDKLLWDKFPQKDPDDGMPLWDYVIKVSKSLYDDAFGNMEGCDGNEWTAYHHLICLADQLRGLAERMRDEGSRDNGSEASGDADN